MERKVGKERGEEKDRDLIFREEEQTKINLFVQCMCVFVSVCACAPVCVSVCACG